MNWMTAFLCQLQTRKSYQALWLTPPSCRHLLHAMPDSERMKSSSVLWQRLSKSSGSNSLCLMNHLAAGWTSGFSRGAIRPSANARPPSSPKYTTSSQNRGTVDDTEEKGYERLPPLDESVAAHLCPPTAIRWKARASHPSKLWICTCWTRLLGSWTSRFGAALYSCASGLPGQDSRQWGSRSGCSFTQGPEEHDRTGPARH